ncbi:MAG: ZIP family metal transporter [Methylophilaceae bacterium]
MTLIEMSPLAWIVVTSLLGGLLSVLIAAVFALNAQRKWVPLLVSYAIGALLGAVFLELLPHAFKAATNVEAMTGTILFGILLFFTLEKLVLWRHCHGDHCEAHALHDEAHCPDNAASTPAAENVKFNPGTKSAAGIMTVSHHHEHDDGRSGMMIIIGDTIHNFVDGILIAAAFLVDIQLGLVTALAIIAHEIPQEIGDFLILLHSGYSKKKALFFNMFSSFATMVGGLLAYFFLQTMEASIPYILALAVSSMLYVAVADLIPGLHKRTKMKDTVQQIALILLGVMSIFIAKFWLEG